ncbi:MAG: Chk1 protein kinase [Bogoriella megaspora]|nr:MAG: Chk1 protein kinase [Bogoriella megaspora]
MGGPPSSQVARLPSNLPFRLVSKSIGVGAYASIRKAAPHNASNPVFAVKFINKDHAMRHGRLNSKQIKLEIGLHQHVSGHRNIIKCFNYGEDVDWHWIAMELAEGGDLFDKVEADEGVGEDIAHFYFTQLIQAISYMHSKGVAHRDIKPENILLSGEGNLKVADFGLACLFNNDGHKKLTTTVCGSPPYIAPEILHVAAKKTRDGAKVGYEANLTDVWSCGIVLFVLLVGNTPWDEPTRQSYEFNEYVETQGRPEGDELWDRIPAEPLSLLHGILKINPQDRWDLEKIRKHPWFTRHNPYLTSQGKTSDQLGLATKMLESLHIDFNANPMASQSRSQPEPMDIDGAPITTTNGHTQPNVALDPTSVLTSTQPQTPLDDAVFDWERPSFPHGISASQPLTSVSTNLSSANPTLLADLDFETDPTLSQFASTPSVPLTLTQAARYFKDIIPSFSLCRFLSPLGFSLLLPRLAEALHTLGVPVPGEQEERLRGEREGVAGLRVRMVDGRRQGLSGTVVVERIRGGDMGGPEVLEVRFVKAKGDPLEWRRLFKRVVLLCKDVVIVPGR